jgi:chorismate mutase/prephenate dehydratase
MTSTLDSLRARIDGIDEALVTLLVERASVASATAAEKAREGRTVAYDPDRERRVLERVTALAGDRLPAHAVRTIFREVMSACLAVQRPLSVAYLGPEGTFSQAAAIRLFGRGALLAPAVTIEGVFDAVSRGEASHGVVPLQNATQGSVPTTIRALLRSGLHVERELVLEIRQCLLSRAASLSRIQRVCSHPQALGQCGGWLRRNLPDAELVQTSSTAAAVRLAREDASIAAIGSRLAGEAEDVPVLVGDVQDDERNATRFVVIAQQDAKASASEPGRDRTLVAFELDEGPGALRRALGAFEEHGVSLRHIESHPSLRRAWAWVFVAELATHRTEDACARALEQLGRVAAEVRVLGSFSRFVASDDSGEPTPA